MEPALKLKWNVDASYNMDKFWRQYSREINYTQNDKYSTITLIWDTQKSKFMEPKNRMADSTGLGRENGELLFDRYRLSGRQD